MSMKKWDLNPSVVAKPTLFCLWGSNSCFCSLTNHGAEGILSLSSSPERCGKQRRKEGPPNSFQMMEPENALSEWLWLRQQKRGLRGSPGRARVSEHALASASAGSGVFGNSPNELPSRAGRLDGCFLGVAASGGAEEA